MNKDRLRMEYAQKKLEYGFKLQLRAQAVQQPQIGGQPGQVHSAPNIYPTQKSFQQFSPFSGYQDSDAQASGFSFSTGNNSYSSQGSSLSSSRWQPNMASSSTQVSSVSSASFPLASQSTSPYSGWEPTPRWSPADDTPKSESLTFTEQLNSNDDDIYD
jgi:hypothetical protein